MPPEARVDQRLPSRGPSLMNGIFQNSVSGDLRKSGMTGFGLLGVEAD
jgi:hypothetical protein